MPRNRVSLILAVLISLILIGCSSTPREIVVRSSPIDVVPLSLPEVDNIDLGDVKFYVITEANYQKVFDELRKKNYDPVIFGVTDDGYEILSVNMAKILQMVQQQKAVIIAYRKYYDRQNHAVEENNESARKEKVAANKAAEDDKGNRGILSDASLLKRLLPW